MAYQLDIDYRFEVCFARELELGLYIVELAYSTPPPGKRFFHMDSDFTVHFIASGRGFYNGIEVSAGKGFLTVPSEPHEFRLDEVDPWTHYWFRLDGTDVARTLASLGMKPEPHVFKYGALELLKPDFDRAIAENEPSDGANLSVKLLSLFYRAMSYYAGGLDLSPASRTDTYLRLAKQFAENNYSESITVEDMAKAANVSSKYLYKLFTEWCGKSPKTYLTALRLERARILLERTSLSIIEVAHAVGYENPNYFTLSFKKYCGCSPVAYRKFTKARGEKL